MIDRFNKTETFLTSQEEEVIIPLLLNYGNKQGCHDRLGLHIVFHL